MSQSAILIVTDDPEARGAAIRDFLARELPGMTLLEPTPEPALRPPPPAPRPLVNFCRCGKRISDNKVCCLACGMAMLKATAEKIQNEAQLERFLARFVAGERKEVLAIIEPHLKFREEPEPDPPAIAA